MVKSGPRAELPKSSGAWAMRSGLFVAFYWAENRSGEKARTRSSGSSPVLPNAA